MRVPPWEVLRPLTPEEVRRVGLDNVGDVFDITAVKLEASKPKQPPPPLLATPPTEQFETIERAQSEMRHEPTQLDEYVKAGQVEVSPKTTRVGCDGVKK
jgi:hypothetical protein